MQVKKQILALCYQGTYVTEAMYVPDRMAKQNNKQKRFFILLYILYSATAESKLTINKQTELCTYKKHYNKIIN